MTTQRRQRLGIMGGMFDPVHCGHLQMAENARNICGLDQVRLIPCGNPVHRPPALVTADQRIHMLELAVANASWLHVDARECRSTAPSYTWRTLCELRSEHGSAQLYLLMGLDAFLAFHTWYHWRQIFGLAHLVVAARPGYVFDENALDPQLRSEAIDRITTTCSDLTTNTDGRILLVTLSTPPVSSTRVRELVREGADTTNLLPPAVAEFIGNHGLYQ